MTPGWIGVDLDATLAFYDKWRGPEHIGEPVPAMLTRVKHWLKNGVEVRIVTARVGKIGIANSDGVLDDDSFAAQQRRLIEAWCEKHIGQKLKVTAQKDFAMSELWDDRCVQIIANTGLRADGVLD